MKEYFEKMKKFCRDHEEAILIGTGCTIGALAASYASTKAMLNSLSLKEVWFDNKSRNIHVTYRNGDTDTYFPNSVSE